MASRLYKRLMGVLFFGVLYGVVPASSSEAPPRLWHPFYVSVTELEYNAKEKTLEISCKVFTDDFEKAIGKATGRMIDIHHPKDQAVLEKQIATYIRQHLRIQANRQPLELDYVGYEIEEQFTYCYFQYTPLAQAPQSLSVDNSVFFELYNNQMSIIHATVAGQRKSTKLDYPQTETVFSF